MKEQLLEGYIYKEIPSMFEKDTVVPKFEYKMLNTSLQSEEIKDFEKALERIYQTVFDGIELNVEEDIAESNFKDIIEESDSGGAESDNEIMPDTSLDGSGLLQEGDSEDRSNAAAEDYSEHETAKQNIVDSINILTKERRRVCRMIVECINDM